MYIAITAQPIGVNYKGSVRDLVNYLEKENEENEPEAMEHFFDQYHDQIAPEKVITEIDNNTSKLSKSDPKFYSMVVSPSQRELNHIQNNPEQLRNYVREMMKDYAASFYRDREITVNDIKYYAKIEQKRFYSETDRQIKENQPYATKILQLKNEIDSIQQGRSSGNIKRLEKQIARLEQEAPHQQNGRRIVQGMEKDGYQGHVHIIVSRKDVTNSFSLSPGSKYKESETILNGEKVKQGFNRDKFYKAAEQRFDTTFNFDRNYVESYRARNLLLKDPRKFYATLAGLPTTEKQVAFQLLHKAGVHVPTIPTNQVQLAYKAFMKLKNGIERAMESGSIGI